MIKFKSDHLHLEGIIVKGYLLHLLKFWHEKQKLYFKFQQNLRDHVIIENALIWVDWFHQMRLFPCRKLKNIYKNVYQSSSNLYLSIQVIRRSTRKMVTAWLWINIHLSLRRPYSDQSYNCSSSWSWWWNHYNRTGSYITINNLLFN